MDPANGRFAYSSIVATGKEEQRRNNKRQQLPKEYLIADFNAALKLHPKLSQRGRYNFLLSLYPGRMCHFTTYNRWISGPKTGNTVTANPIQAGSTTANPIVEYEITKEDVKVAEPTNDIAVELTQAQSKSSSKACVGTLIATYATNRIYSCRHSFSVNFEYPDEHYCPKCSTVNIVEDKQKVANQALRDQLRTCNTANGITWGGYMEYKGLDLWNSATKKYIERYRADNQTLTELEIQIDIGLIHKRANEIKKLDGFEGLISRPLKVRLIDFRLKKSVGSSTNDDSIKGAFCDPYVPLNDDHILEAPPNGSIGVVLFANGDFAGIESIELQPETIVKVSKAEGPYILKKETGARMGAATGHWPPYDDPDTAAMCKSMKTVAAIKKYLLLPSPGLATNLYLQYFNGTVRKHFNSCYRDGHMTRNGPGRKTELAMHDKALQEKLIEEMKSRLRFLLLLVELNVNDAVELLMTFFVTYQTMGSIARCEWKVNNPRLSHLDCLLLKYACRTGEMRNHQALAAHFDGNNCHAVESMMLFGRVPSKTSEKHCIPVAQGMKKGLLYLPLQNMAFCMRPGYDVLHCRFVKTYHVPDQSRNSDNWSYVHGP